MLYFVAWYFFGDPREGEVVYDGMIDRGRGGGEGTVGVFHSCERISL